MLNQLGKEEIQKVTQKSQTRQGMGRAGKKNSTQTICTLGITCNKV